MKDRCDVCQGEFSDEELDGSTCVFCVEREPLKHEHDERLAETIKLGRADSNVDCMVRKFEEIAGKLMRQYVSELIYRDLGAKEKTVWPFLTFLTKKSDNKEIAWFQVGIGEESCRHKQEDIEKWKASRDESIVPDSI